MKAITKIGLSVVLTGFLALSTFAAYGEEGGLSKTEFAKVCEDYHADRSRYFSPPLQNPEAEAERINYEYHYREVIMLPDGSFTDNPYNTERILCLNEGDIWMDIEDGYEVSYEYHLEEPENTTGNITIVEGKTITPYYRAVPLDDTIHGKERVYQYFPNEPEEVPVIPDFPQNYNWKIHGEKTLQVSVFVTVRSTKDGKETSFESNIGWITNLYKDEPDCYRLGPTDKYAYTVQKGDSLYKIAKRFYGNSADWIYILERNEERIPNENILYPGMLLVIPDAEAYR